MIRRPPRSTQSRSSAASDVYKRQLHQRTDALEERVEVGEPVIRRILLPQERGDLRDTHVPKGVNRLEGLRLSRLLPAERAHEHGRRLLQSTKSVNMSIEVVRRE